MNATKEAFKIIDIFTNRLLKINVTIELNANYPYIYLAKVNENVVKEKLDSDYGFIFCIVPINPNKKFQFYDLKEIFKIIRKYK